MKEWIASTEIHLNEHTKEDRINIMTRELGDLLNHLQVDNEKYEILIYKIGR